MKKAGILELLTRLGGEKRIEYSLARLETALKSIGNPERDVNSLVIAGTNGKGTTALLISHALVADGRNVFTYLSPHLQHPSERFLHNLAPIEDALLDELGRELFPVATKFDLTYFEYLTLIAFVWAKQLKAEFLVLEVGMGGRLDATNVTDPIAVALTSLDLDHQAFLGDTREKILGEKLGVLNREGLLFTGIRDPKLLSIVEARCAELDAIYYYSKELETKVLSTDWSGQSIEVNGHRLDLTSPTAGMTANAALSFLLLRIVFPSLSHATIRKAFQECVTPGRFEIVSENPRVVLSGDHNPQGIASLIETFDRLGEKPTTIVAGFAPDKPRTEMLAQLRTLTNDIIVTQISDRPTAFGHELDGLAYEPDAERAVAHALERMPEDGTLLVTGSLYLVGTVRKLWRPRVSYFREPLASGLSSFRSLDVSSQARSHSEEARRSLSP